MAIGNTLHITKVRLLISADVFHGLLVAISIFIGFFSVILVFYLGKIDEHEREMFRSLNEVRIYEQQLFTNLYEIYSKFESYEHKSMMEEYGKELFRSEKEKIESSRLYSHEMRDDVLKELSDFRSRTILWGIFSLVMYLVGLFACILALLILEENAVLLLLYSLSIASVIIVVNISIFIGFWWKSQKVLDVYRKFMVNSHDYVSSRFGEMMADINKILHQHNVKDDTESKS